jgi:hypothetical protein
VWLGTASIDSDIAMRMISNMQHGAVKADDLNKPEWVAVLRVLPRDYWSRIWILQEISWANDITIACGDIEVDMAQFLALRDEIFPLVSDVPHQGLLTLTWVD